jgi:pimeloyl-ACP methyl ester carboxylesterase
MVTSADGTQIAYELTGSGPPLVLVHGAGGSHVRWESVLPELSAEFTVCAVDRRGRGASGDAACYCVEREFEDVVAVVEALGERVSLLGHSFGAICTLEAPLLTDNIDKLILCEPPITAPPIPEDITSRLQASLDAGDREGVLVTFLSDVAMIPEGDIERMRHTAIWPERIAAAHTLLREGLAVGSYRFDAGRFGGTEIPTLLMLGGDSPTYYRESIEQINAVLPNSRVTVLPGQQHVPMDTAPELFVREILGFLLA